MLSFKLNLQLFLVRVFCKSQQRPVSGFPQTQAVQERERERERERDRERERERETERQRDRDREKDREKGGNGGREYVTQKLLFCLVRGV